MPGRRLPKKLWTAVGLVGFFVLVIAAVLADYFANVHEEFFSVGQGFLDCGTIFDMSGTPLAVANCGGRFDDDVAGFATTMMAIGVAIAAMVVAFVMERSRPAWRR